MKNRFHLISRMLLMIFFSYSKSSFAQNSSFHWAASFGSTLADLGKSAATDNFGSVYTLGEFRGTVDFDPSATTLTLSSNGSADLYLTKTDVNGNTLWAKSIGGTSAEKAGAITLDAAGNIYITGSFQNTVDFDPSTSASNLTSVGAYDVFVLKLNSTGNYVWARNMGGTSADEGNCISVSSTGDVYTTGFYNSTADFDPSILSFNLNSVSGNDIFVCKLTSSGNFAWAKSFGGSSNEIGLSITTNTNGIFFTGYFQGTVDFDPNIGVNNLNSSGSNDPFICKLDFNGLLTWAFKLGGTGADVGSSITTDANGDVLVTGQFNGAASFNSASPANTLTSAGSTDVFVAKYSNAGSFLWVKRFGGSFADYAYGIAVDALDNVYTTGSFKSNVDFDPNTAIFTITSNSNSSDAFLHKLDPAGNLVWVKAFGDSGDDEGYGLTVDNNNNVFSTGYFRNTVDFNTDLGTYTLAALGSDDAYLHKVGICNTPISPLNTTSNLNLNICNGQTTMLTASGSGLLTWYPSSSSSTSLATGPIYNTPTLSTGTYSYYIEAKTCTTSASRTQITVNVSICNELNEIPTTLSLIKIYPNPNKGTFILETEYEAELVMLDLFAKEIIRQQLTIGKHALDLSKHSSGVYLINVRNKYGNENFRLVKE